MSDDKRDVGASDRAPINVSEADELQSLTMTMTLGVSAGELRTALQKGGPVAAGLRRHRGT